MTASASQTSAWGAVLPTLDAGRQDVVIQAAVEALKGLPLAVLRDRAQLAAQARSALATAARQEGMLLSADAQTRLAQAVIARVGGLGFLHHLLPPARCDLSEITVNPDGSIWVLPKGAPAFQCLDLTPERSEIWRAVEALLAPLGRALSEAAPSVDAKLPRGVGFGGARVKVLHPVIAPGDGVPSINIRLFEPKPIQAEQLAEWGAAPANVLDELLQRVRNRARVLVIGSTATGKTTWVSALANGIPHTARVVKIEDPEEIHLALPNVVTIEARPAAPGASVLPYTVRHGVDDAMRMSPQWLIVGEVRTGDAALALFRAQMSDHPGLSTFHAEGPANAVQRMAIIMLADAGVPLDAAQAIFAQAVDLVLQVGWRDGRRALLSIWRVAGLRDGQVQFDCLWKPGMAQLESAE